MLLVGRDRALRALEQAYARTHAGQGAQVLISGEAGIGKSRLMQEFATRLRGHALVLTGAAYADAQRMPYQPIAEALRSALSVERFTFDIPPIWLSEASRLLPELRALHPDLPPPMAVKARLGRLISKARLVLKAGAVLGPVFGFDWVHQTAGRGEMETMGSLDELMGRQLLVGRPEAYRFQHEIIRTAVYQDLSYGRRRLLHRRAGEALESLQPEDVIALAWHFERAGAGADKAADYLLQAGDQARGLYAHQEAIDFYRRALALLEEQGDPERAARTLMKLGLTYHKAFDLRHARQAYGRGFALWQRAGARQPAVSLPPASHALRVDWPYTSTLDPTMAGDIGSAGVIDQLFSGLMELTPELDVVPDVAYNWEVVEGGRKYVFHLLRDDVVWSDGTPVTAGDFEGAWKRLLDPATESPFARLLYDVKGGRAFHQGEDRRGGRGGAGCRRGHLGRGTGSAN